MPVIPKDPLDWLTLFRQQFNEIFNYLSALERKDTSGEHAYTPLADIFETVENYVIEIDLPGFDRNDLSLSICCNMLVIEGFKRKETRREAVTYICIERCFGRFCKTIEIPPAFDAGGVSARYEHGVLVVAFPRIKDKNIIIREIPIG